MDKDSLIKLTTILYQLTVLFPKKEPLRYKIREVGNDILASFVCARPVSESLEVLQGFLEIAKAQNWVSPSQVLNLQSEYSKLEEALKVAENSAEAEKAVKQERPAALTVSLADPLSQSLDRENGSSGQENRQGKIIEFLKENGQAQVWQLKQVFPEVSKRTLRRDFEDLLEQGRVERIGERNDTFYRVKII